MSSVCEVQFVNGTRIADNHLSVTYDGFATLRSVSGCIDNLDNVSTLSSQAWVTRGQDFKIDLRFTFHNPPQAFQDNIFIARICHELATTKIWSALDLVARVERTDFYTLSIGLIHQESALSHTGSQTKDHTGYSSRLAPPSGISIIELDSIVLDVVYCWVSSNTSTDEFESHGGASQEEASQSTRLTTSQQSVFSVFSEDLDFRALDDEFMGDFDDASIAHSQACNSPANSQTPNLPTLQPSVQLDSHQVDKADTSAIVASCFILLDAVLKIDLLGGRDAIHLQSRNVFKGINLPRLCPNMFSPGYLQAMNERSGLVTNAARSLARISDRAAGRTSQDSIEQGINVGLWRLAQESLFNPKASYKLSSSLSKGDGSVTVTKRLKRSFTAFTALEDEIASPNESLGGVFEDMQAVVHGEDVKEYSEQRQKDFADLFAQFDEGDTVQYGHERTQYSRTIT